MKAKLWIFVVVLVFIVSGCSAGKQTTTGKTNLPLIASGNSGSWPTKGWQVSTPAEQGMDPAVLEDMRAEIEEQAIPLDSLLIVRNGVIVWEQYFSSNDANTKHPMYSVTKSFVSTLVGIALDQGKLKNVDQRVADLLPGSTWQKDDASKQAMTLENLLTMSSGLDWVEGDPIYNKMYASTDWVQMVMDLPMATDGGKKFVYCSGCSHVLSAIVQESTGSTQKFAQKNLFEPLGITNLRWETDSRGIAIGGWGLNITPRDMAKLGYLYLNNGNWDGKQIVSSAWVKAASTRHIDTDGDLGYGYQWWIYPTHNAYTALGRYGQTIFVAPEQNLIVVTTARIDSGHDPIFRLIDNYIFPSIKK